LMRLTRSIVLQDAAGASAVLLEWADGSVDFDAIQGEAEDFISQYYGIPLSQINIPQIITDATDILRNFNIALPPDIALFSKACLTLEGFGRLLNPDFDLMKEAEPMIRQWGTRHYSPLNLAKKLGTRALNFVDRMYEEPKPAVVTQKQVQAPGVDKTTLETLARRHHLLSYRQTHIAVCCAFMIMSAVLCLVDDGPQVLGLSLIGLLGLLGSIGALYWQLFLMWWSHRNGE
jgi:ubiquinone biosynthesis protein